MAVGDFNNDGVPDLAIAVGGFFGGQPSHYAAVFLSDGKGGFSSATSITNTGANPLGLVVGDFNNDGKMDFATANYVDNTVSIFLGDGTGNFTSMATTAAKPVRALWPRRILIEMGCWTLFRSTRTPTQSRYSCNKPELRRLRLYRISSGPMVRASP